MSASAVTATGLTKWFGAKLALDAIDLEGPAGTVLGFLAPHGGLSRRRDWAGLGEVPPVHAADTQYLAVVVVSF